MPAAPKPPAPDVLRAARLSRVPGVTIDQACRRFGVSKYAVQRLRRQSPELIALTIPDLVLAALTREGRDVEGTLGDLAGIAAWIDYVNHRQAPHGRPMDVRDAGATVTARDGRLP